MTCVTVGFFASCGAVTAGCVVTCLVAVPLWGLQKAAQSWAPIAVESAIIGGKTGDSHVGSGNCGAAPTSNGC